MSVLHPVDPADADARGRLLALNEESVALLSPLDDARLDRLLAWSAEAWLVRVGDDVAGFVITVPAGSAYDSVNYRAHAARFDHFTYLDRIAIAPAFRRRGLGSAVYDEIEASAAPSGRLTLEVNIDPPNEPSLAFHRARGYQPVGEQPTEDGHRVVLMVKDL